MDERRSVFKRRENSNGAKVCKSCRSRHELSNEYLLANIGFDTAETGLLKVCQTLVKSETKPRSSRTVGGLRRDRGPGIHTVLSRVHHHQACWLAPYEAGG